MDHGSRYERRITARTAETASAPAHAPHVRHAPPCAQTRRSRSICRTAWYFSDAVCSRLLCGLIIVAGVCFPQFFVIVVAASRIALVAPRFGLPLITGYM